jgi:hypothetical protein
MLVDVSPRERRQYATHKERQFLWIVDVANLLPVAFSVERQIFIAQIVADHLPVGVQRWIFSLHCVPRYLQGKCCLLGQAIWWSHS